MSVKHHRGRPWSWLERRSWLLAAAFLATALVAPTAGCRRTPDRPVRGRLRIAAASDLSAVLGDLIVRFSPGHPVDISASYGSSGTFYNQLLNHAPFDLFLSADVEYPTALIRHGVARNESLFTYGVGKLVLWVPAGSRLDVSAGLRTLVAASVHRIAIANPQHAPYGRAAVAALRSEGLYDAVKTRLAYAENITQALQFAQSGAADAGVVASSLALMPSQARTGRWVEIPRQDYPPIEQAGVILDWAADIEAAREFRAFLTGEEGRRILDRYGFSSPDR